MIQIAEKKECAGCCACAAVCPKKCIQMVVDQEGFIYPNVKNDECVNCCLCEKVCPVKNTMADEESDEFQQKGYVVQHKNPTILRESTAGGAFTAIAVNVIERGGVVFGAELLENLFSSPSAVHHVWVDEENDLVKFRNSKYIQSFIGDTFNQVELFLKQGRQVCFSGTPCQVEGLTRFLELKHVDLSQLILVDVVCRAVPSPMIFRKYVEHQEKKNSEHILSVRFRDKYYGYKYSTMNVISDTNHGNYHRGVESDPWLMAFFSNICDRPSCYDCKFRKLHRVSDFTIWDCFNVDRFSKELDNDKGATRILIHSIKGQRLFEEIKNDLIAVPVEVNSIVAGVKELKTSVSPHEMREVFFADANNLDGFSLFEKYFPETLIVKVKRFGRMTAYRLGIYSFVKKIIVKVTKKY